MYHQKEEKKEEISGGIDYCSDQDAPKIMSSLSDCGASSSDSMDQLQMLENNNEGKAEYFAKLREKKRANQRKNKTAKIFNKIIKNTKYEEQVDIMNEDSEETAEFQNTNASKLMKLQSVIRLES